MLQLRNFLFILGLVLLVSACNSASNNKQPELNDTAERSEDLDARQVGYYGKKIDEAGAINGKEMKDKLGSNTSMKVKVKGEVVEVCKEKGCWLHMDMEDGTTLQIDMNKGNFTVPKDITGRIVIAEGTVKREVEEIENLADYAQEVGKTEDEAKKTLVLESKLSFTADGVIIK
ncbi:MAG: DUF4920 domain-containing protein [Bacteroidia bacterium]